MKISKNQHGMFHHISLFILLVIVMGTIGFVGFKTWQKNNIDAKAENKSSFNHYYSNCNPSNRPTLKAGSSDSINGNSCVKALQRSLNDCCNQKLSENGLYDEASKKAVMDFQALFNRPQTGIVDDKMWGSIDYITEGIMKNAGLKYKKPQQIWDDAKKDPMLVNGMLGTIGRGSKPNLIIAENFYNGGLSDRGWGQSLNICEYPVSAKLQQKVILCRFDKNKDEPIGGSYRSSYYYLPKPTEEFTLSFKVKVEGPSYKIEDQILHSFGAMSAKSINSVATPANSYGTLYFDPLRKRPNSRDNEADWGLVFQDNQALNCSFNKTDKDGNAIPISLDEAGISDRSVGGLQQGSYAEPGVRGSYWGNPCKNSMRTYDGQTIWSFNPNNQKRPIKKGQWTDVVYYIKLNTPGKQDGLAYIAVKSEKDKDWLITHQSRNMIYRSNGMNRDFKIDILAFGPWASSNKYKFNAAWTDLRFYEGDAR